MGNGVALSNDPYTAMQEFNVWRARRFLRAIYDDVGAEAFGAAVDASPGILDGLFMDDGLGVTGHPEHAPVPGVGVTVADVEAYTMAGDHVANNMP